MRQFQVIEQLADGAFHSGEDLARALGLSRSGVWKILRSLNNWGIEIYAVRGKGYRLADAVELLDAEQILAQLNESTRKDIAHLDVLPETDSTNRFLLRRPGGPAPGFSAVFAERQTAGRGRRGKNWLSPFGHNIYCSVQWGFPSVSSAAEGVSLVVAIAIARVLKKQGADDIELKWPNDVYWRGQKLAGILLEMAGESSGPCQLILGIGLNVKLARADLQAIEQPCTDLCRVLAGRKISRNRLAADMLNELHRTISQFLRQGLSAFMDEWKSYDYVAGKAVTLHLQEKLIEGIGHGIDHTGALLVKRPQGVQRFLSGEVSVRLSSRERH